MLGARSLARGALRRGRDRLPPERLAHLAGYLLREPRPLDGHDEQAGPRVVARVGALRTLAFAGRKERNEASIRAASGVGVGPLVLRQASKASPPRVRGDA